MHKVALEKPSFSLRAANFFGVLGYITLLIEWVWAICLLAYPMIKSGNLDWIMPAQSPTPSPVATPAPANGATMVIGIVITIICICITVYALYTMPKTVGKAGAHLTHKAADSIVPAITHHKQVTKKNRLKITFRAIIGVKLAAIVLPVMAVIIVPTFAVLSKDIVLLSTFFIASWALFHFAIQVAITKLAKLNPDEVW